MKMTLPTKYTTYNEDRNILKTFFIQKGIDPIQTELFVNIFDTKSILSMTIMTGSIICKSIIDKQGDKKHDG